VEHSNFLLVTPKVPLENNYGQPTTVLEYPQAWVWSQIGFGFKSVVKGRRDMPSEASSKPGSMADIKWNGRSFIERAFDSLQPARLRQLFQGLEARRQPSEASEQPSKPPEHQAWRRTSQRLGSEVSKENVDRSQPSESRGLVGRFPERNARQQSRSST